MTDPSPGPFRVVISRAQMEALEGMAAVVPRAEFLRWLRELDYRLSREPDEWGESREFLPAVGLQVRFGAVGRLAVWYGVKAETRTVYLKRFRLRGDPN